VKKGREEEEIERGRCDNVIESKEQLRRGQQKLREERQARVVLEPRNKKAKQRNYNYYIRRVNGAKTEAQLHFMLYFFFTLEQWDA